MPTGTTISDQSMLSALGNPGSHPTDSSRILLGLMTLSERSEKVFEDDPESDPLRGVISRNVLRGLLSALHHRDAATVGHSRRVAQIATGIAEYVGWEGRQLKVLEVAGLLHDIGKIGVPDNILFKPAELSVDESELMALHYNIGIDVLQAFRVDREVLEIVQQSQAQYNGAGEGTKRIGHTAHQGARILAVADAYDSLANDKVYRSSRTHEETMDVLMESAGTQFDGNVVCTLSRWIESEGLPYATPENGTPNEGAQEPASEHEAAEASWLCHIFSYLYVLESLYDGFYLVDSDLKYLVWNLGAEKMLGYPAKKILGQPRSSRVLRCGDATGNPLSEKDCPINQVIADGKPATSIIKVEHENGRWIDVELQSVPLMDEEGRLHGVAEIFRDLSRAGRRPLEYRELKLAASRDALTSVANRGELETQLAMMTSEFAKDGDDTTFSLIFSDVDFFKSINDTYGHTVGDRVLIDLAKHLQHESCAGELVARYGGEEFVILCPATELEQAVRRAERLRVSIERSSMGGLQETSVTSSFGVAQAESGDSVESLLRRADKALYMAKESGRNCTCSLTNDELLAGIDQQQDEADEKSTDPFLFVGHFDACIGADMIVYKMGGFVSDHRATLVEVTPNRAVVRMGSRGLLPFWGGSDARRPIELEIEFGDQTPGRSKPSRSASRQVDVEVRVRPLGWIRDVEVFQARAKRVMKVLRSYFAA